MAEDRQFTLQGEGKHICLTFALPFNILLERKVYISFLFPDFVYHNEILRFSAFVCNGK